MQVSYEVNNFESMSSSFSQNGTLTIFHFSSVRNFVLKMRVCVLMEKICAHRV